MKIYNKFLKRLNDGHLVLRFLHLKKLKLLKKMMRAITQLSISNENSVPAIFLRRKV